MCRTRTASLASVPLTNSLPSLEYAASFFFFLFLCSICFEELDLGRKEFAGLSDQARAFITALLVKDPEHVRGSTWGLIHERAASDGIGACT